METHLYNPGGDDSQYEVEPNVGKNTPESRNEKHPQVFDLASLSVGDHPNAQADYHKHIEGSAAHYGARAELPCKKVVATHLAAFKEQKRQSSHKHTNKIYTHIKYPVHIITTWDKSVFKY